MMSLPRNNDHNRLTRIMVQTGGFIIALLLMLEAILVTFVNPAVAATTVTAHDFVFDNIEGGSLPLADYRGKTVLLVNTASQCGFTGQYEGLQALWETYRERGLVVIGVPSDDFGGQEPGNAAQIKSFCEVNFGIDFPMADKVRVKGP
jgi:glutathione peroxidase